jgi:hypothetical protein
METSPSSSSVSSSSRPSRECAKCSKSGASSRCSRCCSIYYCSQTCQATDWKRHKSECVPVNKTSESGNLTNSASGTSTIAASSSAVLSVTSASASESIDSALNSSPSVPVGSSFSSSSLLPGFPSASNSSCASCPLCTSGVSSSSCSSDFPSLPHQLLASKSSSSANVLSFPYSGSYLLSPYPLPAPLHSEAGGSNGVYIPPCRPILRTSHLYFPLGNIPPLSCMSAISATLLFPSLSGPSYSSQPLSSFPPVRIFYSDVGDVRHFLQSFVDLALKIRTKTKRIGGAAAKIELGGGVEVHLNDHEPRIMARAVLLLVAAAQCGRAIDSLDKGSSCEFDRFCHWTVNDHACFLFFLYGSFQLTQQQQRRLRYLLQALIALATLPESFASHPWTSWLEMFDHSALLTLSQVWRQWLAQTTNKLAAVEPMWRAPDGVDKEAAKHLNHYYRTGCILLSPSFCRGSPSRAEQLKSFQESGVKYESSVNLCDSHASCECGRAVENDLLDSNTIIPPPSQEEYLNSEDFLCNPTLLPLDFHESRQKFLFARDPYSPLLPKLSGNVFQQGLEVWIKYAQALHTVIEYSTAVKSTALSSGVECAPWCRILILSRDPLYHLHASQVLFDRILVYHQPEYTGLQPLILIARTRMNGPSAIIETSINFPSCFTLTTTVTGTATYSPDLHKFCLLALNANVKLVKNMMGLEMELYNYAVARVCVCRFMMCEFSTDLSAPKGHISDGFRVLNDWFMTASTPILMHDEFAKIDPHQLELLRLSTPRSVANMRTFMLFVSAVINNNIVENSAFRQRLTALFSTLLAPKNPFLCDYTFASFMTHLGLLKQPLTPLFSFVLCPTEETTEEQMRQHALFYTSLSKLELCSVQFDLPHSMSEMSQLLSSGLNLALQSANGHGPDCACSQCALIHANPATAPGQGAGGVVKEAVLSLLIVTAADLSLPPHLAQSVNSQAQLTKGKSSSSNSDRLWCKLRDMDMLHWLRSKGRDIQLLDAFTYDAHSHTATFWIHSPYMSYARSCSNAWVALMDFDRLHVIGDPVPLDKLKVLQRKDQGMNPI